MGKLFASPTSVCRGNVWLPVLSGITCAVLSTSGFASGNKFSGAAVCFGSIPSFSMTTFELCIPAVQVSTGSGNLYYSALLSLNPASSPLGFDFKNFSEVSVNSGSGLPTFDPVKNLVTIPTVEIAGNPSTYYSVQLAPKVSGGGLSFTLLSATPTSAPDNSVKARALNDTGISASQCFQTGSDTLVACSSSGATTLNTSQDGMVGRDVTANNASDGALGFSFTKVCNSGDAAGSGSCPANPALGNGANDWGCTRDTTSGLTWEIKTTDGGLRDWQKKYTSFIDGTQGPGFGTTSDTSGYVTAVNTAGLCGAKDWRLPTRMELFGLVSFSGAPYDTTFFPNTQPDWYWTSVPLARFGAYAWGVNFTTGFASGNARDAALPTRLVRGQ